MMSVLRRLLGPRERPPGDFLTGSIGPDKDGWWSVMWSGDGAWPQPVRAQTLTETADQASAAAADLYASHPARPIAELQLAIFPWNYRSGPIFDISGGPGDFIAQDLDGSCPSINGTTLEDLVASVKHMPGAGVDHSMFRWIRQISAIPGSG